MTGKNSRHEVKYHLSFGNAHKHTCHVVKGTITQVIMLKATDSGDTYIHVLVICFFKKVGSVTLDGESYVWADNDVSPVAAPGY